MGDLENKNGGTEIKKQIAWGVRHRSAKHYEHYGSLKKETTEANTYASSYIHTRQVSMVGIQDRLQNLHVAIADIFEPDGQEEGSPPLCMRWLERSVCAAGTLNIFARSLSWNHSDCLLVQRSTVPSCAAESNSLVLSISWLPISGLVKEWLKCLPFLNSLLMISVPPKHGS